VTALTARWSRDLRAVLGLALLGLILALVPGGGWPEGSVLLLLVIALPGYALAAALFPPGSIPVAERTVYVVAVSIALAGLGGVLTQIFFDLDRGLFIAPLLTVTLAACWIAQRRRELLPFENASPRFELPGVNPFGIVAMLVAVGIAGGAFSTAVHSMRDSRGDAHFTALWVLPEGGGGTGASVSIGIGNHEGRPVSFGLRATRGREALIRRQVRLARGERWETSVRAPAASDARPLRVALIRSGRVYREAFLRSVAEP
jgi:uncharacterized membrane protein